MATRRIRELTEAEYEKAAEIYSRNLRVLDEWVRNNYSGELVPLPEDLERDLQEMRRQLKSQKRQVEQEKQRADRQTRRADRLEKELAVLRSEAARRGRGKKGGK